MNPLQSFVTQGFSALAFLRLIYFVDIYFGIVSSILSPVFAIGICCLYLQYNYTIRIVFIRFLRFVLFIFPHGDIIQ